MNKLIKLHRNGPVNAKWYICPTVALRDLIIRNRQRLFPGCNYVLVYKDTQGYGVELTTASWVTPGHTHFA